MPLYAIFNQVLEKMKSYHPSNDFTLLEDCYRFITEAHGDQKRKSGEPYITHPLSVALILANLELDKETIVAGMLHDVVEDTPYTHDDICRLFSEEIALLVDGVTKLEKIPYSSKEELKADNYRKMFLAMAKDIRVIIIKLADRLHNMRTLNHMRPEKQKEIAQETLDIYAPLAKRLGISSIQTELEDLSLKYLQRDIYDELASKIERKQIQRIHYVEQIVKAIQEEIDKNEVVGVVEGRPKHFFSIYKKMLNQDKTLDQIYDLIAVRVIVEELADCYAVYGLVAGMYKPVPGRFKNYIATPKANNYRSLHDTLIDPDGNPFEIQIRTREMHRQAEYGIAAHWKYKAGKKGEKTIDSAEEKLTWLRQILEFQRGLSNNKEFMEALKTDLDVYSDQVYAFSPKGDIISLRRGCTPIDFAYMIHSAVGNRMVGAKVNGKIVPIDYQINNGDRVDILTSQNSPGPSLDWLKIVKSQQARYKINQWFKNEFKEENMIHGRDLLERESKKKGYDISELMRPEWVSIVLDKYGFVNWDALCAAIGHGGLKEGHVLNRLLEEHNKEKAKNMTMEELVQQIDLSIDKKASYSSKSGIIVQGGIDVPVRFSHCCNPVPGDEIIGFVTRGRGVSIHRTDCVNIINVTEDEKERLINVDWHIKDKDKMNFTAEIKIICDDRNGILVDITRILTDMNISIKTLNARTNAKRFEAVFDLVIVITSKKQLETLTGKVTAVKGVHEIERVST